MWRTQFGEISRHLSDLRVIQHLNTRKVQSTAGLARVHTNNVYILCRMLYA